MRPGGARDRCELAVLLLTLVWVASCSRARPAETRKVYPLRWVYASRSLQSDADVEDLRRIVATASEHGLNGLVLSAGLDRLDLQPPEYFRRLEEVKRICANYKMEIIPIVFSAGYGGSVLAHNKNLAAGLPVKDALYVVRGDKATLVPDPPVSIRNGGFELFTGPKPEGFDGPVPWGEVVFRDTEVVKEGKSSLRFENFDRARGAIQPGQVVKVRPYRCYRVSCWVKTEGLEPYGPFSSSRFRIEVIATADRRRLQFLDPALPTTTDWRRVAVGFNSWGYDEVEISPHILGGKTGRIWLDDLRIEEVGLVNLLRRPGTPLVVKGETSGVVYQEGVDFARVEDKQLDFRWDHDGPPIQLLPGSRIRDGERLRVSYYHGISVHRGQVSICMSEPEVYEIWRKQLALMEKYLAPRRYFLSMDEVRAGGTCKACRDRNATMGEILGDCIRRQFQLIRQANPQAEVFVWSDMLDPNHNAGERAGEYYYLTAGSFSGSWEHVPKELVFVCWWHQMRDRSLAHFSSLGFRTLAAAYYDADDLQNVRDWLLSLDTTPGALGIMYTTWQNKYALLAEFGDLVSR